jgi:hypothetical protein
MRRLILITLGLVAGCADQTQIKVKDYNMFLPSGRMSIDIDPRSGSPSRPHGGHALELGVSGGRGDYRQNVDMGSSPLTFGGRTFNSPVELDHAFKFRFAEGVYRFRHFAGASQDFGLEGRFGLAHAELELTVSSPATQAQERLGTTGIVAGFGAVQMLGPRTSLEPRATVFWSGTPGGVTFAARAEYHLVHALSNNMAVRAGYTLWLVRSARERYDRDDRSAINLDIGGFALGLDLMF